MPLHSASYFAGVGTVVATMAIGFGGGVMLTDAFVGKSERAPTLMERRAAPLAESTPVVAAAPAPQANSQQAAVTPAPQPPVEPQPPQQQAAAPQPATVPQQAAASQQQAAAPPQATEPQPAGAQPVQTNALPAARERPQFEQSMGQMREIHLRQSDVDARKAAATERRKQERRKWAERRKQDMEKVDELTAVTEKVKQIERRREREPDRSYAAESPRSLPVFGIFGGDDDD